MYLLQTVSTGVRPRGDPPPPPLEDHGFDPSLTPGRIYSDYQTRCVQSYLDHEEPVYQNNKFFELITPQKFVKPHGTTVKSSDSFNRVPQPQNRVPQPQHRVPQPQNTSESFNRVQQSQNRDPQLQNRVPQPQNTSESFNRVQQFQNRDPQPHNTSDSFNRVQQFQNRDTQPQNNVPQPQNTSESFNSVQQSQNRVPQPKLCSVPSSPEVKPKHGEVTRDSKEEKKKKWSLGGLFRRRKKVSESESSSPEEDTKLGFLARRRSRREKRKQRANGAAARQDDASDSLPVPQEKASSLAGSRDRLSSRHQESSLSINSSGGSGSLEGLSRRERRAVAKQRAVALRPHESSSEDDSYKTSSLHRSGSLSRRSRCARTERYIKRLSRDEETVLQREAETAALQHRWYQDTSDGDTRYCVTSATPSPGQSPLVRPRNLSHGPASNPASLERRTRLNATPRLKGHSPLPPPHRQSSYENFPPHDNVRNVPTSPEDNVMVVQFPVARISQFLGDPATRGSGFVSARPGPPPPPPRDPQRRVTSSLGAGDNARPMSYAFEEPPTRRLHGGSFLSLNNQPTGIPLSAGSRSNSENQIVHHRPASATPGAQFQYYADQSPRSRKPIHIQYQHGDVMKNPVSEFWRMREQESLKLVPRTPSPTRKEMTSDEDSLRRLSMVLESQEHHDKELTPKMKYLLDLKRSDEIVDDVVVDGIFKARPVNGVVTAKAAYIPKPRSVMDTKSKMSSRYPQTNTGEDSCPKFMSGGQDMFASSPKTSASSVKRFTFQEPPITSKDFGMPLTTKPTKDFGVPLANKPTKNFDVSLTAKAAKDFGTPLTTKPTKDFGVPLANKPTNAFGVSLTAKAAKDFGVPLTANPTKDFGVALTAKSSKDFGVPLANNDFGVSLNSKAAKDYGTPLTAKSSKDFGVPLTAKPTKDFGVALTAKSSKDFGVPLTAKPGKELTLRNTAVVGKVSTPPAPPVRRYSRHFSDASDDKDPRSTSGNLEDALDELEAIYKSLQLGDEDLLDRAERRDLPTKFQLREPLPEPLHCKGSMSDSGYDLAPPVRRRAPAARRSGVPDRVNDDMAYRRLHPKDRPNSQNVVSHAGSYLLTSPVLCPSPEEPGRGDEPDVTFDDVVYRNIRHVNNTLRVSEPQLPFGIPNSPVSSPPASDYLRSVPSERYRPTFKPRRTPDVVGDDLAFRALRKDGAKDGNLLSAVETALHNARLNDTNFSLRKRRAVRSLSANIGADKMAAAVHLALDADSGSFEKAQSLTHLPDALEIAQKMLEGKEVIGGGSSRNRNSVGMSTSTETLTDSRANLQDLLAKRNSWQQKVRVNGADLDRSLRTTDAQEVIVGGSEVEDLLSALARDARSTSEQLGLQLAGFNKPATTFLKAESGDLGFKMVESSDLGFKMAESGDLGFKMAENSDLGFNMSESRDIGFNMAESGDLGFKMAESGDLGFNKAESSDNSEQIAFNSAESSDASEQLALKKNVAAEDSNHQHTYNQAESSELLAFNKAESSDHLAFNKAESIDANDRLAFNKAESSDANDQMDLYFNKPDTSDHLAFNKADSSDNSDQTDLHFNNSESSDLQLEGLKQLADDVISDDSLDIKGEVLTDLHIYEPDDVMPGHVYDVTSETEEDQEIQEIFNNKSCDTVDDVIPGSTSDDVAGEAGLLLLACTFCTQHVLAHDWLTVVAICIAVIALLAFLVL